MRSQLTDANISNINGGNWVAKYSYHDNGDMAYRTIQSDSQSFSYNGHLMTNADGNALDYDENGQLTSGIGTSLVWNWDNKLRSATKGTKSISLKYDPSGNRICKNSSETGQQKYIVDIVGDLPVILLVINPADYSIDKTYIYANSQILAEHTGSYSAPRYFYLHDRLGSVRQVINSNAVVVKMFTFEPFGETIEEQGSFYTSWQFAGQYLDSEIGQYHLRARQYNPYISRFTSRDFLAGNFEEPLSLHRYLYCENEPISRIDLSGLLYQPPALNNNISQTRQVIDAAVEFVRSRGFPNGPIEAFSWRGLEFDYKFTQYTFQISRSYETRGSEFTNWLTGYTCTYLYGTAGNWGSRLGGHYHALRELGHFDEAESRYFLSGGILMGDKRRWEEIGKRMNNWDYILAKSDLSYGLDRMASMDLTSTDFDKELELYTTFWNSGSPRY